MTKEHKLQYKKRLHQYGITILQERIDATMLAMQNAQAAANSEEKSSAGDKYETGRAMSHLEKDMHARQLVANQNELASLLSVQCNTIHSIVSTGSIVIFNGFTFFIAAGLGKIIFDGEAVYLLSPSAPVAKLLLTKIVGDKMNFNNKEIIIENIF